MQQHERATVAIVGYGPVGIMLAGLLGRRGIDVIAVDLDLDVFPLPRAAHMDHTTLRTLQELELLEGFESQLVSNTALVLADDKLEPLVTIPAATGSKSGHQSSVYFYQPDFDRYIGEAVSKLPTVRVRRGVGITALHTDADGVTLNGVTHTGESTSIRADWVIGCDGARSMVRESIGAVFESLNFDERWLVLDLMLGDDLDVELPTYALQVCNPGRPWVANMVPGGRFRVEVQVAEGEDEKHLRSEEFLRDFLRPLMGEAAFQIERNAVYDFHGLVADTWRQGRVFLAGDSAHLMPPFLGQGMVSGTRDAQNLAWKLAGVIDGTFPESILDTYESERSPHVRSITASAIEIGRFVGASDPVEVAERNRRLRAGDVSGTPGFRLPALEQGPLVVAGGGDLFPQPVNPVSGRPELDAVLGDALVIVSMDAIAETDAVRWWKETWGARLVEVSTLGADSDSVAAWFTKAGARVAIVRPDRYVLGAGESLEAITEAVREHQDRMSQRG